MAKVITYECNQCGCEITVSEGRESNLMPIYCCGVEVSKVSASAKKALPAKKKTTRTAAKKTVKKVAKNTAGRAARRKKVTAGKRTSRK